MRTFIQDIVFSMILKYNTIIECQGLQHFKNVNFYGGEEYKKRTKIAELKRKYRKNNGLRILCYSNY